MIDKILRDDEEFVIGAVAGVFSGNWKPGEDPPDAYLSFDSETVAVEISTLSQHVTDDAGAAEPRLSQDATALALVDELNKELGAKIPQGCAVHLVLKSPINAKRKLKPQLAEKILDLFQSIELPRIVEYRAFDNAIKIQIESSNRDWGDKVVGIVMNQNASADILANARFILDDRIKVKNKKCEGLNWDGRLWLALFNDYWLAGADTYRQAIGVSTVPHRFDRILVVSGNATVESLYETTYRSA
jgi:hypothetical protein